MHNTRLFHALTIMPFREGFRVSTFYIHYFSQN